MRNDAHDSRRIESLVGTLYSARRTVSYKAHPAFRDGGGGGGGVGGVHAIYRAYYRGVSGREAISSRKVRPISRSYSRDSADARAWAARGRVSVEA